MRVTRIYQSIPLKEGCSIFLDNQVAHHVLHVLRLSINDPITLFNGKGGEYAAFISEISKKTVAVTIKKFQAIEKESPISIHVGQSLIKNDKMDFVIQKTVELGAHFITPLLTERVSTKLTGSLAQKRIEHWQNVIISACEQCGRNTIPVLFPPMKLIDWIKQTQAALKLILSPDSKNTFNRLEKTQGDIAIAIGPEGGFSPLEIQLSESYHFKSLSLGPRILRTETAAIAAVSILQTKFGDLV